MVNMVFCESSSQHVGSNFDLFSYNEPKYLFPIGLIVYEGGMESQIEVSAYYLL